MKTANLAGAVLGTILKVVFVVVVVYLVYTGASTCYDYGYRIFTEPAVSAGEGRKITRNPDLGHVRNGDRHNDAGKGPDT